MKIVLLGRFPKGRTEKVFPKVRDRFLTFFDKYLKILEKILKTRLPS
jgi:hypothetical protein